MIIGILGVVLLLVAVILAYAIQEHKKAAKNYKIGKAGEEKVYDIVKKAAPRKSILISNLYLTARNKITEVDLVLITTKGIFVFEVKNYKGFIYGNEKVQNWTKKLNNGKMTTFYNPVWQNEGHIRMLKRVLPELEERFFHSYVVFTGSCQLKKVKVRKKQARVLKAETLRKSIRRNLRFRYRVFGKNQLEYISEQLHSYEKSSAKMRREHKKQIKQIKKY